MSTARMSIPEGVEYLLAGIQEEARALLAPIIPRLREAAVHAEQLGVPVTVMSHGEEDESILFELIQSGYYASLELFSDGDGVYLNHVGDTTPAAWDFRVDDVLTWIDKFYVHWQEHANG